MYKATKAQFGKSTVRSLLVSALLLLLVACSANSIIEGSLSGNADNSQADTQSFSIAVIPDTQNYVDYKHQARAGFALDSSALFIEQMQYIASRAVSKGGDIAFVAAVGDVWQHQSKAMDKDHADRGFETIDNPYFSAEIEWTDKTLELEVPKAIEGYKIISEAGLPFGVAPGNHDYDAMWSVKEYPPNLKLAPDQITMTREALGLLHIGGLDNFRSAFGSDTEFFRDKPWYISSFAGGANSAQRFSAGGYTFLNINLEMQAGDEVLAWIETVLADNPGLPTMLTTHDYLDPRGQRAGNPIVDLETADPDFHNSAEELWEKLIQQHDQIFLVVCGHHHGQAMRVDNNIFGNQVYQVLADYQDRGRAGLDNGQALSRYTGQPVGIGDGWFRLMTFSLAGENPQIKVTTYSTYFDALSDDLPEYANWYRDHEQPGMSDSDFYAAEAFTIDLVDFKKRFGAAK